MKLVCLVVTERAERSGDAGHLLRKMNSLVTYEISVDWLSFRCSELGSKFRSMSSVKFAIL